MSNTNYFDYAALSLYTGVSGLKPVIDDPNCSWVLGQWNGINKDSSAQEIKKDIDSRLELIIDTFKLTIPKFKTWSRHFVIPEFFFHCAEGPYPYVKVDGNQYPFEYIVSELRAKLLAVIPNDSNYYHIVIGSALTSNVEDYGTFLNSTAVLDRQAALNSIISPQMLTALAKYESNFRWKRGIDLDIKDDSNLLKATNSDLDALNAFMRSARSNPLCIVRNRGALFFINKSKMADFEVYVYEKQNESTVDLTMGILDNNGKIATNGMITEWLANYPSYSILSGDKHTSPESNNARICPTVDYSNIEIGVEICLDHRLQRLRRTVDMTKENGAAANNYPLQKQIIPSGGMQILDYAVAAVGVYPPQHGGVIFNADGCEAIYTNYSGDAPKILNGKAGIFKGITAGVYNKSIQSLWTGRDGNTYYSHSQFATSTPNAKIGGFNNALGLNNQKVATYEGSSENPMNKTTDSYTPTIIPVGNISADIFATEHAEIHHYSPTV